MPGRTRERARSGQSWGTSWLQNLYKTEYSDQTYAQFITLSGQSLLPLYMSWYFPSFPTPYLSHDQKISWTPSFITTSIPSVTNYSFMVEKDASVKAGRVSYDDSKVCGMYNNILGKLLTSTSIGNSTVDIWQRNACACGYERSHLL